MRVCLLNPPWQPPEGWGIRSGCRFPNVMPRRHNAYTPFPFMLAYTAACLERDGHQVLVLDGIAERASYDDTLRRIAAFEPDLVVAESSTTSLDHDLAFLGRVHERATAAPIAMYGSHVSARPADGLVDEAVSYVVRGEPEQTVCALAGALEHGDPLASVRGLAFRRADGTVTLTLAAPAVDVHALPHPKRAGLPMDRYHVSGYPTPVVFVYGSRGCPAMCSFCLWVQTLYERGAYRPRRPEDIVAELVAIQERMPDTRSFFFDDDTFNLGRGRLLRFAELYEASGVGLPWGINARADHWPDGLMERLRDAGLFNVRIGIESADPEVLRRARKKLDLDEARRNLQRAHDLGIEVHLNFVVGLPGETPDSVRRTVDFVRSVPADSVQLSVAVPFPGTELYEQVESAGHLETTDWSRFNGSHGAIARTDAMSVDEIARALESARRRIYFNPRFIARRMRYTRDPRDLLALAGKATRLLTR